MTTTDERKLFLIEIMRMFADRYKWDKRGEDLEKEIVEFINNHTERFGVRAERSSQTQYDIDLVDKEGSYKLEVKMVSCKRSKVFETTRYDALASWLNLVCEGRFDYMVILSLDKLSKNKTKNVWVLDKHDLYREQVRYTVQQKVEIYISIPSIRTLAIWEG